MGVATAAKKRYEDEESDVRFSIDLRTGEYETFRRWLIVDNDAVPALGTELTLQEAEEIDPELKQDDTYEEKAESVAFFFFQAEDGIRVADVTGVQTCALPICSPPEALAEMTATSVTMNSEKRRTVMILPMILNVFFQNTREHLLKHCQMNPLSVAVSILDRKSVV